MTEIQQNWGVLMGFSFMFITIIWMGITKLMLSERLRNTENDKEDLLYRLQREVRERANLTQQLAAQIQANEDRATPQVLQTVKELQEMERELEEDVAGG